MTGRNEFIVNHDDGEPSSPTRGQNNSEEAGANCKAVLFFYLMEGGSIHNKAVFDCGL